MIVVVALDIETVVSAKAKMVYVKELSEAVQEIEAQSILLMHPFVLFWKRRRRRKTKRWIVQVIPEVFQFALRTSRGMNLAQLFVHSELVEFGHCQRKTLTSNRG